MKLPFLKKRKSNPAEFWEWFQSAEGQAALAVATDDTVEGRRAHTKISEMLASIDPKLSWGRFLPSDGDQGQFDVSASGLRELIPTVLEVVSAAPDMGNYRVVAFKQPGEDFTLTCAGQKVDSSTVLCQVVGLSGETIDLDVFVPLPAGAPKKAIYEVGFIMLDHVLGEYAVMARIGGLEFDLTVNAPPTVMPLKEFAAKLLSGMKLRLEQLPTESRGPE